MTTVLDRLYVSGSRGSEDRESTVETVSSHEQLQPTDASFSEQDVPRPNPQDEQPSFADECPSNLRALRLAKNRRMLREQATRAFRDDDQNNKVVGTTAVLNRQKDEEDYVSKSERSARNVKQRSGKWRRKVNKTAEQNVDIAETNVTVKLQQFHLPEIGSVTDIHSGRDVKHRKSSNDAKRHRKFGASGCIQREITLDDVQKFFLHRKASTLNDTSAHLGLPRGVVHLEEIAATERLDLMHDSTRAHESSSFTTLSSYGVKPLRPETMDGVELRATALCDSALVRRLPTSNAHGNNILNKLHNQAQKSGCTRSKDDGNTHGNSLEEKELLRIGAHVKPSNEFNEVIRIPPLTGACREITSYAISPSSGSPLKKKVIV